MRAPKNSVSDPSSPGAIRRRRRSVIARIGAEPVPVHTIRRFAPGMVGHQEALAVGADHVDDVALGQVAEVTALLVLTPFVATPAHALAWGVTASGVVQLGTVLWAAARAGMALRIWRPPSLSPEVRAVLRRMGPGVIGAGVTQLNLVVGLVIASTLPAGAVSFLYYADRIGQLPLGVIGAAVGTALLPLLSRQLRAGERLSAHRSMNRAIEFSLVLCLPAAMGQAAAALPLVETLFQRGAFGPAETAATAKALAAYALGLPAYVLVKVFAPGFFARGDTGTPVRVGVAAVALNLVLTLLLTRWLSHVGVALATALSAWFNALMLGGMLVRRGSSSRTGGCGGARHGCSRRPW